MKPPVWSRRATADVIEHIDWVERANPVAARQLRDAIDHRANWLAETPYAGAALGSLGMRSFHVLGTNYLIIYRPVGQTIEIVRVRHQRQNWRS